jgi:hypothetical protein
MSSRGALGPREAKPNRTKPALPDEEATRAPPIIPGQAMAWAGPNVWNICCGITNAQSAVAVGRKGSAGGSICIADVSRAELNPALCGKTRLATRCWALK